MTGGDRGRERHEQTELFHLRAGHGGGGRRGQPREEKGRTPSQLRRGAFEAGGVGGGMESGAIGTDAFRIMSAIEAADTGDGVAILADLGSGIMSAEMAIEMLDGNIEARIADAPVLEGAISAAVASTSGASLDEVIAAAEEARTVSKLS